MQMCIDQRYDFFAYQFNCIHELLMGQSCIVHLECEPRYTTQRLRVVQNILNHLLRIPGFALKTGKAIDPDFHLSH